MYATSFKSVSLHFIEAGEVPLAGKEELYIDASPFHRFGISVHSVIRVSSLGEKARFSKVGAGELVYIPRGLPVKIQSASLTGTEFTFISFEAVEFAAESNGIAPEIRSFRMPQMKNWRSEFLKFGPESSASDFYQLQSRLYAVASAFMKSVHQPVGYETTEITGFVERTRQRILDEYDTALDMEELARSSGAGASRFYKTFRRVTGLSPLKFLITTRLNASLRLLADRSVSVTEAAHSVGYPDEYYFSRLFKKQMGLAPTEYASRAQVSVAALCPLFAGDLAVLGLAPCVKLDRDWDADIANRDKYLQEIEQARPDHILTGPLEEELLADLRKIAPVTVYYWHQMSWKKRLAEFGRLLRLETVADRWLADFESKTDNAKQHVEERWPDTPFLIVGVRESNFRIYGKQRRKFTDLLYDELNFKSPSAAEEIGFKDTPLLREVMELSCDNVLFLIEFPAEDMFCEQLKQEWASKPADREGRRECIFIRLNQPFQYNSAMHERLVDQIVHHLFSETKTR